MRMVYKGRDNTVLVGVVEDPTERCGQRLLEIICGEGEAVIIEAGVLQAGAVFGGVVGLGDGFGEWVGGGLQASG